MSTAQTPAPAASRPPRRARQRIKTGYWLAAMIALACRGPTFEAEQPGETTSP